MKFTFIRGSWLQPGYWALRDDGSLYNVEGSVEGVLWWLEYKLEKM